MDGPRFVKQRRSRILSAWLSREAPNVGTGRQTSRNWTSNSAVVHYVRANLSLQVCLLLDCEAFSVKSVALYVKYVVLP